MPESWPCSATNTHLQPVMGALGNFIGGILLQSLHHQALTGVYTNTHTNMCKPTCGFAERKWIDYLLDTRKVFVFCTHDTKWMGSGDKDKQKTRTQVSHIHKIHTRKHSRLMLSLIQSQKTPENSITQLTGSVSSVAHTCMQTHKNGTNMSHTQFTHEGSRQTKQIKLNSHVTHPHTKGWRHTGTAAKETNAPLVNTQKVQDTKTRSKETNRLQSQPPSPSHTSDRLLQELCNGVCVVRIDGSGEHKLSLHLREALSQQSPTPTQWLSHQGLHTGTHKTSYYNWQKQCVITTDSYLYLKALQWSMKCSSQIPSHTHTYTQSCSNLHTPALWAHF